MKSTAAIEGLFQRLSRIPPSVGLRERPYYLGFGALYRGAVTVHIVYLTLFLFLHVWPLVVFNILSIGVFTFGIVNLVPRRLYSAGIVLFLLEGLVHHSLCIALIGWNSGFQFLLITVVVAPAGASPRFIGKGLLGMMFGLETVAVVGAAVLLRARMPPFVVDPLVLKGVYIANLLTALVLVSGVLGGLVQRLQRSEDEAEQEHQRAEGLLGNILPVSIAERLKEQPKIIADGFADATVLFSDIVGFTLFAGSNSAEQVVATLNEVFTMFDEAADRYDLEKIKTIGDAYMVAAGIPQPGDPQDQAERIGDFALEMIEKLARFNGIHGTDLALRIGINSGPVVAGVIGKRKFSYDLWGDTVNLASRMESHGLPNRVQVGPRTHQLLESRFILEPRGVIEVKGKGPTPTWMLVGRKEVTA